MKNLIKSTLVLALFATPALAGKMAQNHHCMKDGAEVTGKTKKQCKADGGKWEKMAAADAPAKAAPTADKPAK